MVIMVLMFIDWLYKDWAFSTTKVLKTFHNCPYGTLVQIFILSHPFTPDLVTWILEPMPKRVSSFAIFCSHVLSLLQMSETISSPWLISLNTMAYSYIHVSAKWKIWSFLTAALYLIMYIYHQFHIHSSPIEHLGWFHILAKCCNSLRCTYVHFSPFSRVYIWCQGSSQVSRLQSNHLTPCTISSAHDGCISSQMNGFLFGKGRRCQVVESNRWVI